MTTSQGMKGMEATYVGETIGGAQHSRDLLNAASRLEKGATVVIVDVQDTVKKAVVRTTGMIEREYTVPVESLDKIRAPQ